MSLGEDFISKVCNALKEAYESGSGVTLEGREREFRRVLARRLFDEVLGWEGHSKIGEIYDITCYDDENFPIIDVETKWGVELTPEIKEKLRKRIEELGSVKYGVFASERDFIVYEYADYKLKEITKINVAEATGVSRGEYGLSEEGKKRILKLEILKRERLVWIEDPDYFEKTYKEISVAKIEGVRLLTLNLKDTIKELTIVLINFFNSYMKRKDHYTRKFLENTFNDWLKISMKEGEFSKCDEIQRRNIIEIFCRETTYVIIGRILFTRICEDKDIIDTMISGKGIAEFLKFYGKRKVESMYLRLFNDTREEIKKYYTHFHELGFFDWYVIEEVKKGTLTYDDKNIQDNLEKDLDYSLKKAFRKLNRFDFTDVNRDVLGNVYQGYLPPEERKQLGEFYTPTEIIQYILDAVLYKPDNEIRGKKLLDPACGSGSFLVEATTRLIERYRRIGFNLKDPDDAKQIIEGSVGSIYGLDIHPFACFIAEMNLLFQFVDLYDVVRQKDRYYKLPRINVYCTDSLTPSGGPIELTEFFDNSRRKMLIEETKGADKVKSSTFEYVVGNPPYVRQERIAEYKHILKVIHPEVYQGRADLYIYFLKKGIDWLSRQGKLGVICSNMFIKRDYGKNLREYVLKTCKIENVVDFGDSGVFKDVVNYPCILIFERRLKEEPIPESCNYIEVFSKPKDVTEEGFLEEIKKVFSENREIITEFYGIHKVEHPLPNRSWRLASLEETKILDKIKKRGSYLLGDICEKIFMCAQSNADTVHIVSTDIVEKYGLEHDILKPLVRGEDIKKWRITWRGLYLIYPHRRLDDRVVAVSEKEMKEKYPYTWEYLNIEKNKKQLIARHYLMDEIIKGRRQEWYELWIPKQPEWFEQPKIFTPDISNANNFAYDPEGKFYAPTTVYGIIFKENMKEHRSYLYLLGLLNSKVLEFYFKHIGPFIRGRYYRYNLQFLNRLPIKLPSSPEDEKITEQVVHIVNEILHLNEQINSSQERINGFPNSYFKDEWSFNKLADVIKAQSLSKESYTISEKSLRTDYRQRDLDDSETFKIILATNEFMGFYSEDVASFVFEVLKKMTMVTKRELLELNIPSQSYLKSLMNQHRKDKEQIVKNEKAVEELEKQIDDLVYKLYDIAYAERRIIEDYLKKF
jgi:hypothetical protein